MDHEPEHSEALRELFKGIAAVAQAGIEQDQGDVSALELPEETLKRAAEIFKGESAE